MSHENIFSPEYSSPGFEHQEPDDELFDSMSFQSDSADDAAREAQDSKFTAIASAPLEWLLTLGLGQGPVTPESAREKTEALFGKALGAGLLAHGLAALWEKVWIAKHLGLTQTAGFVAAGAGFAPIISAVYNPAIQAGYAIPYAKYWRREYRPNGPSINEAREMFFQAHLSRGELRRQLEYAGWPDHRIEQFFKSAFRTPSTRELTTALREADYSGGTTLSLSPGAAEPERRNTRDLRPWLNRKFLDQGFTDEDAGILGEAVARSSVGTPRGAYVNAVVSLYREGWMTEAALEALLRKAGMPEEAVTLNLDRARLQKEARDAGLILDAGLAQFKAGILNNADLEGLLRSLGVEARTAAHLMARAVGELGVREFKKAEAVEEARKRALSQASFEGLARGVLSPEMHLANLTAAGFPQDLALNMAERDALRVQPSVRLPVVKSEAAALQEARETAAGAVLAAVRAGSVDPPLALASLFALGEHPAVAQARVQAAVVALEIRLAREKKVEEESEERAAERKAAVEAARAADARAAALSKVAGKVSSLLTSTTLAALKKGLLPPGQAFANLISAGVDPALAEAMVENALIQAFKEPSPPKEPKRNEE